MILSFDSIIEHNILTVHYTVIFFMTQSDDLSVRVVQLEALIRQISQKHKDEVQVYRIMS